MKKCERCDYRVPDSSFALLDYCAVCGKNRCDECMKKGCCGNTPARSGMTEDYGDDEDDEDDGSTKRGGA